jgi:hypothetical protein
MNRTPSSILKGKRESSPGREDDSLQFKKARQRNRRVSFAPKEDMETVHFFQKVGAAQPAAALRASDRTPARAASAPLQPSCPADRRQPTPPRAAQDGSSSPGPRATPLADVQNSAARGPPAWQQQPLKQPSWDTLPENSPAGPAASPMSMELTGDTPCQRPGAGLAPRDDSGTLPLMKELTHSITQDVPGLSTLVEEDEEELELEAAAMQGGLEAAAHEAADLMAGGLDGGDGDDVDMDLTGPAVAQAQQQAGAQPAACVLVQGARSRFSPVAAGGGGSSCRGGRQPPSSSRPRRSCRGGCGCCGGGGGNGRPHQQPAAVARPHDAAQGLAAGSRAGQAGGAAAGGQVGRRAGRRRHPAAAAGRRQGWASWPPTCAGGQRPARCSTRGGGKEGASPVSQRA